MTIDVDPTLTKHAPGFVGALVALGFIPAPSWTHRISSFIGGIASAHYGTDHVVKLTSADAGVVGFVLGLFGMAVAAKVFETIAAIKPAEVLGKLLSKWGL